MTPLHCVLSLLFLLCCLCPKGLVGQHPYYYQISDEQGLPSNEVYDLLQDSFGYMWLGCDAGLFRYDGFQFKQYKNAQQNGRSISSLRLDGQGRVWCKNFNGQVYCAQGDSLHLVFNQTDHNNGTFVLDAQDRMWTIFEDHFQCYDHLGRLQKKLPITQGQPLTAILSMERYGQVIYAVDQRNQLLALDLERDVLSFLPSLSDWNPDDTKIFVPSRQGLGLLLRSARGTRHRFYWLKNGRWRLAHVFHSAPQNNRLYRFCENRQGQLWLGTNNGAFLYRMDFDSLHQPPALFRGKKVSSVFLDREGQYWFTTLQHGIFVVPHLSVLRYDQMEDPNLTALAAGQSGEIWLGGHTGWLQRLDLGQQKLSLVPMPKDISLLTVKDIALDEQGQVWVSHGGLSVFAQGQFKRQYPLYNVRAMAWARDSLFYIAPSLHGWLAASDLSQLGQANFEHQSQAKGGRSLLYQPEEQALYWILADGLYRYHQGQWTALLWQGKPIFASDLACFGAKTAVATVGQGLLWIENGQVIEQWAAHNSILEAELRTVALDRERVWIVGHRYLYAWPLQGQGLPQRYGFFQGINAKDINQILLLGAEVYLATNRGLWALPVNLSAHNAVVPQLRLLEVWLGEQRLDKLGGPLQLPHNHGQLNLVLSSTALRSRGRYEHWYRLQGLDSTWNRVPASQARLVYPSIPPGQYRFEAKAVNESGVESQLLGLDIVVTQPYWQQWWFYVLVSLLTAVVVSFLAARRIRAIQERGALENQLTASQLTALKAQMNPHFMYNALNSIQALLLQQDVRNSSRYLSKFSTLMRKVLDASGRDWISLADELEILELYLELEKLRFGEELSVSIRLAEGLEPQQQQLPSMILQPFVENALKHGLLHKKGLKTLELSFELDDKFLYCMITDNGIGRQRAQEIKARQQERHHSFATQAAEKRMALLNQYHHKRYSIEVEDLQGAQAEVLGTRVKVLIPVEEV